MLHFVLDRACDFALLQCAQSPEARLIAIGAEALTGIPPNVPRDRITLLSSLISAEALAAEVTRRVSQIWPTIAAFEDCPYYKAKQLLDSVIEKQVIVEQLARLPGEKRYVSSPKQWVSADGDNPESCRLAAVFMASLPDFTVGATCRQRVFRERLYRVARLARRTLEAARNRAAYGRWPHAAVLLGATGYGAAKDFEGVPVQRLDMGSVILAALLAGRWLDAIRLAFHDAPIKIAPAPAERWHFHLSLVRKVIERTRLVQNIIDHLPVAHDAKPAYYFTVNYSRLGDIAIVRALRRRGVSCFSMQHACVGHDTWTASQYLDLWESDAKLVANQTVANALSRFEEPRRAGVMLPVSLPMYRGRGGAALWDARSVLYILTGFTRANTMYDNRRINDALYLEAVQQDLALIASHFETRIRSHPYDIRQYGNAIARYLGDRIGCQQADNKDPFAERAVALIDSPSTILADMVLAGRPVIIINRTARLMPEFTEMARHHHVLFDTVGAALNHLKHTTPEVLARSQQAFARAFIETYCTPTHARTIPQAIDAHLEQRTAVANTGQIACAR